jgi:hypothetical protein
MPFYPFYSIKKFIGKIGLVLFFCFFGINLKAQDTRFEYFSDQKYADYPLITFKENFFNQPIYFIDGVKASANEVRAFMEIMPGDANDFSQTHTKTTTGTFLNLGGQAVVLGALGYAYNNRNMLNNDIVRNWFFLTIGGGVISAIGKSMNRHGVRKINNLIENHNYLISEDQIGSVYLKMDFRQNFLGEKIDIYDGPNLLDKARIRTLMQDNQEIYEEYKKALNKQKISFGLDITGLLVDIVVISYVISPQFQSSAPSNLLIPLVFANLGLNIASSQFRRSARNLTRHALHRYNFGDRALPLGRQNPIEFRGPSVTLFRKSFE